MQISTEITSGNDKRNNDGTYIGNLSSNEFTATAMVINGRAIPATGFRFELAYGIRGIANGRLTVEGGIGHLVLE